jgi:hypothetical protein
MIGVTIEKSYGKKLLESRKRYTGAPVVRNTVGELPAVKGAFLVISRLLSNNLL